MFSILNKLRSQIISDNSEKPNYSFQLDHFINERHQSDILLSYTKCNLEILEDGLLVIGDFISKDTTISIQRSEIKSIALLREKKAAHTLLSEPNGPKSALSTQAAKYFGLHSTDFSLSETKLHIICKNYQLKLSTSSSKFTSVLENLISFGYDDRLKLSNKTQSARLHSKV